MTATQDRFTSPLERMTTLRAEAQELRPERRSDLERPPGPTKGEIWGSVLRSEIPSLEFIEWLASYGPPLTYAPMPRGDVYLLNEPELLWDAFVTAPGVKGFGVQTLRPVVGDGILTSEGARHRRHRAMVQPAFTGRQIVGYGDAMVAAIDQLDRRWSRQYDSGNARVEIVDEMSGLTLDIVGRTLFGMDFDPIADEIGPALTETLDLFTDMVHPKWMALSRYPSRARRRLVRAVGQMDAVVGDLIDQKRSQLAAGATGGRDMMTLLMTAVDPETGAHLTDDELRDEILTLILAGHETTAMLLSWTWLLLFQNPDIKEWVAQEWDAAPASLDVNAVKNLPRTRAVLAESLRLRPPAWLIDRVMLEQQEFAGYVVPQGAVVLGSQHTMHRDPRFWPDAPAFRPDRWIDESGEYTEKIVPRGAYFPFGFAPRRCIGDRFALAEAALTLALLGRRWHVVPLDPGSVVSSPSVTQRPSTGLPSLLRRRAPGG